MKYIRTSHKHTANAKHPKSTISRSQEVVSLESNRTRGFPSRAEVPTDLLFVRDFIVFNYDLCSSVLAVNKGSWYTLF